MMASEIRYVNPEVSRKMRESANAFREKVWPCIEADFGAGTFEPVEGRDDSDTLAKLLDSCGIDAFVVHTHPHRHMFGLASRTWSAFREGGRRWDVPREFSLRQSKTYGNVCHTNCEYEKLKYIFLELQTPGSAVHPHYTVHATFLDKDADQRPIYIATVETSELIRYVARNEEDQSRVKLRKVKEATFICAPISLIKSDCPSVREYRFVPEDLVAASYSSGGIADRGYLVYTRADWEELSREAS
jgi:hypothetical protein